MNSKEKKQKRIQGTIRAIAKRVKQMKDFFLDSAENPRFKQPHRLNKLGSFTCGNSKCVLCGNPRKFFSELTMQEKSFAQTEKWTEE